ncbi:glutathione S-transferase family protein [Mesorhizobium sp. WSM4884]|uniref:glutathione S-transferase family protein n=1 Tax=Mesorhizobium sp. WSM4884 TaxID=3038542 RepID=UPI0024160EE9|nr:glutathione S-transferase family protein [Mesorhizobium sp. WSM4884]MDG4882261.1 glutathione S-transferase family protein [Mesorhizobium sp. WSM4884]
MYKAVGSRGSRVSRVLWMLEELGQPYEFIEVKLRSPEAYALNPSGKVPILIDGEVMITDSAAICVYLADKHADRGMGAGPGLAGRAEIDSWMHFAQSELEAPLWNKLRHRFLLPKEVRVDVGPATAHDFASEVKALDRRLGDRPFALGDRFSAVDVLLGDIGGWARAGRFPIDSDRVNAYFVFCSARPALARKPMEEPSNEARYPHRFH